MADLDLKKFKKIGSDKNTTKLRHNDGHMLVIAHSRLSPKLKKELDKLPVYAAEGVDTGNAVPMDSAPSQGAPDDSMNANPAAVAPSVGQGIAPQDNGQDINQYIQNTQNDLLDENQKTQQDIDGGHITPKTYADLFANKSTLGKVGTIFGLMVGGAGSGLSHQPNALLAAMKQQIQNDLDAQKTSAANKLSWYKANLDKNLNEAQVKEAVARGLLTNTQAQGLQLDNQIKAHGAALGGMGGALINKLSQGVQNIPLDSPVRPQAEQALNSVNAAHQVNNAAIANKTANQSALVRQKYGNPSVEEFNQSYTPAGIMGSIVGKAKEARAAAENPQVKDDADFNASASKIPGDKILSPDAEAKYTFSKVNPLAPAGLQDAHDKAVQMESLLPRVHGIMSDMYSQVQAGGYPAYARRNLTPDVAQGISSGADALTGGEGIATGVGRAIGAAENLVPKGEAFKNYDTSQQQLKDEIRKVLPNAGNDEVMQMVRRYSPEYGDTQSSIAKKEAALKKALIQSVPRGPLKNAGMLAEGLD